MPKDSVIAVTSPCPATIVASVTRNGVMRRKTTQNPLIAPKAAPVASPTKIPAKTPKPPSMPGSRRK